MLNFKKKVIFEVNCDDLEDAICAFYGINEFAVTGDLELGNDSDKKMSIEKKPLDAYDAKELKNFKDLGYGNYMTRILLTDMCNAGEIEPGDYLIRVS